jgi:hypothetical protein
MSWSYVFSEDLTTFTFTQSLFVFALRVCVFFLSHLLFFLGPAHSQRDLPLVDSVAIASSCILVIAASWLLGRVFYYGVFLSSTKSGGTVFSHLFPSSTPASSSENSTLLLPTNSADRQIHLTPWVLWYYIHAVGVIIFVLAYSIPGLSSFPSLMLIISMTCSTFVTLSERGTIAKSHLFLLLLWTLFMTLCFVFLFVDVLTDAASLFQTQSLASVLWVGLVLPVACSLFLSNFSQHVTFIYMSPADMVAFTLPSLVMLSISYLSLYVPLTQSTLYMQLLHANASTLEDYQRDLLSLYNSYLNKTFATSVNQSTLAEDVFAYAREQPPLSFFNATLWVSAPSAPGVWDVKDPHHSAAASIVLTLLCPPLLFVLMLFFLSSFVHVSGKTQTNVTAFAVACVLRRYFAAPCLPLSVPRLLALLSVTLSAAFLLATHSLILRAPVEMVATGPFVQQDEDDEVIVFQREAA